jgi:hypothetical protein
LAHNRPDSLVIGLDFEGRDETIHGLIAHLPRVAVAPSYGREPIEEGFLPRYASIGKSALGMLHRGLVAGEKGIPRHEETVVMSSGWGVDSAGSVR